MRAVIFLRAIYFFSLASFWARMIYEITKSRIFASPLTKNAKNTTFEVLCKTVARKFVVLNGKGKGIV